MAAHQPPLGQPVLVVGEALIDMVVGADDGPSVGRHVGGSPANVAVGLSRLAHDVRLVTCLGQDMGGDLVRSRLAADGVELVLTVVERTSTATAYLDAQGSAQYHLDLLWDLHLDLAVAALSASPAVGHLHTGSLATAVRPGNAVIPTVLAHARNGGLTTSYDPNVRPAVLFNAAEERPAVEELVAGCDVVKASDEDLAWLYPGRSVWSVADKWLASGPALVVITRGADGAVAWHARNPDRVLAVPALPVQVVDTVGAGDAFMAGLLSGLVDGALLGRDRGAALRAAPEADLRRALDRAAWTSAMTCTRAGSDPPRRDDAG